MIGHSTPQTHSALTVSKSSVQLYPLSAISNPKSQIPNPNSYRTRSWSFLGFGTWDLGFEKGLPTVRLAGSTGLEPAASAVTGQRSNQLNYDPSIKFEL